MEKGVIRIINLENGSLLKSISQTSSITSSAQLAGQIYTIDDFGHPYERGLRTIKEVAEIFYINERTVAKYLQIYQETGGLSPKPSPGNIIKRIIILNQDGTLQDFRDAFKNKTGIYVAISTMLMMQKQSA